MSNVIQFPSREELGTARLFEEPSEEQKYIALWDLTNIITSDLMEMLNENGYWLEEERDTPSLSLVMDAIHSLLLHTEGVSHPLQGISEMMYDPENANSEMTVILEHKD